MKTRSVEGIVVAIAILIIVYGIVPLLLATPPNNMKSGGTYYLEGKIVSEIESSNGSIFVLNTSSGNVTVYYQGVAPAVGSYVLVKGTYKAVFLISIFEASEVYYWLYIL
ncbi:MULTISPECIES: hypothetical protein [unclassified Thermoplasma]|uniref:hypothetical protein n=1 Tax=unclassified Thermoplasma TaxID=2684908 RepID=UPI000D8E6FF8|nr:MULTISPECIES: hypothetical protein [unclassified Thermoplasma]PYB68389.1 hypothetical protein DMB44_03335 [Thermoplasma sp. Kam2015]